MREVVQMPSEIPKIKPSENPLPASEGDESPQQAGAAHPPDLLSI